jgi:signal transduction histidine kinase
LINVQEATRADIARDLHDDVCQEIAGVALLVSSLKQSSGRLQDPQTQGALATLERSTRNVVEGVRRLSHDLHPETLRLLGLAAALKSHCVEVPKRYDVGVTFTSQGDFRYLHPDIAVCVFRIAQEALRNAALHGHARQLAVSLANRGETIELTVADDGCGFDLEAVRRNGDGLGLVSMEERAYLVRGNLQIVTRAGHGTTISVRVPASLPECSSRDGLPHLHVGSRRSA